MNGFVLFMDGKKGNHVIYTTPDDKARKYVYRQHHNAIMRVYIEPGQSVAWIECDVAPEPLSREAWQMQVIEAVELARPNFPWHKVREGEWTGGWLRRDEPATMTQHLLLLVSTGERVQRRCRA